MSFTRRRNIRRELLALSEDLFGRSVDATLSIIVYLAALAVPQPKSGATLRAQIASDQFLNTINYDVIKKRSLLPGNASIFAGHATLCPRSRRRAGGD